MIATCFRCGTLYTAIPDANCCTADECGGELIVRRQRGAAPTEPLAFDVSDVAAARSAALEPRLAPARVVYSWPDEPSGGAGEDTRP